MRDIRYLLSRPVAPAIAAKALLVLFLLLLVVLAGGCGGSSSQPPRAVRLIGGVPVGVQDSPAGALAAADDYVALASQSVEQDPAAFAALIAQVYAPEIQARTLAEGRELRASDTQNMANYAAGGHGLALVGARRLDSYTPQAASVTTWLGGIVWGPRLAPRQTWNLIATRLRWQAGRWLVVSCRTERTPAPVPAIVYVTQGNDRSSAFARLGGMSAPLYGTDGG
jgi:hypothetical protein